MWRLVLSALPAMSMQSFAPAPLRWGGDHERSFVLAANGALRPSKALRIWDQLHMISSDETPAFAPKPDQTIAWGEANMCIEAHGDKVGDEIRINHCTGGPNQLWSFLPSGSGQKNQIQLKNSRMCIDVKGKASGLNGALVELQECSGKSSEFWSFEESISLPRQGQSAPSLLRRVTMPLLSMLAVGALSLGVWLWPQKKLVVNGSPLDAEQGGICLSAPLTAYTNSQEMVPAVMAVGGSALTDWTDPSCPRRFAKVEELIARVELFTSVERDYLMCFWSERLSCFQIVPRAEWTRPSLSSSCTVLDLILDNKEHWRDTVSWSGQNTQKPVSVADMVRMFMDVPWTGDALQTPQLVATLAASQLVDKEDEKFVEAVKNLLEQRSRLSLHRQQSHSTFLRYQNAKALLSLMMYDMVPEEVDTNSIIHALQRADMVATDELSRQLAFSLSKDSTHFDVIMLGFATLTHFVCSSSQFLVTDHDTGVVPTPNMELISAALKVIFSEQFPDGTFRKGEPIIGTSDKRDIGNLYVFFFDLMHGLLKLPSAVLIPYIPNFERCLNFAENNIVKEVLEGGQSVQGWKSNHVNQGGAVCWATASVFRFLDRFHRLLRSVMIDDVLREFGGKGKESVIVESGGRNSWAKLMDADLILGDSTSSLKNVLFAKMLLPQLQREASLVNVGGRVSLNTEKIWTGLTKELLHVVHSAAADGVKDAPSYSAILFGPPGTAKTTIVQNMASTIGWNFVTIDTADFLADGLGNIAGRMTYVFDKLKNLEKTVILFDEIEEFCLDRGNPQLTMESRLLTTAMLTQLNNLRRQQKNIFVVATNRLRAFDAAVIRPGRFDMLLFVGTPNKKARTTRLKQKLSGAGISVADIEHAVQVMQKVWNEHWDDIRFSTYAENEKLTTELIALLKSGTFSEVNCLNIISQITRTATIEGDVKEEYIDSEVMSRL